MGASSVGEFSSLLLLSIFFSTSSDGIASQVALLGAFAVLAVVGGLAMTRLGRSIRALDLIDRLGETPAQLGVRIIIVVMLLFLGISTDLGFEAILGSFVAGALLRVTDSSGRLDDPTFKAKIEAIGYGFLIPAFFVTSGLSFDAEALLSSPSHLVLIPILLVGILAIRGLPAITYRGLFSTRQVFAAGLLQSTTLSMMVIAAQVGAELGTIDAGTSAALLTTGIITVLCFPPVALQILGSDSLTPGWESSEDVDL
jgi:Kef-type K+ transport system membrane component KefB